jgi:hypothetical protein
MSAIPAPLLSLMLSSKLQDDYRASITCSIHRWQCTQLLDTMMGTDAGVGKTDDFTGTLEGLDDYLRA